MKSQVRGQWPHLASRVLVAFVFLAVVLGVSRVWAQAAESDTPADKTSEDSTDERLDVLEAQVKTLATEVSKAVTDAAVPADGNWENYYGMGPAAAKVYRKDAGLSIGGYGEVLFSHYNPSSGKDDIFDTYRAVLYVGYKFSDKWVLNSEFEFEHGGASDVFIEFLNLDYQATKALNFRVGLILNPMGFVNQVHEPTFYYGGSRPEVEKRMIPTTWRENGGGVYGRLFDRVSYQAYALSSLDGQDFSGKGYRSGRQKGIKALTNNWSFVARADVDVIQGLMAGGSVYTGHQGQDQGFGSLQMTMYELHAQFKRFGFTGRVLFAQGFIENPDSLNLATTINDGGQVSHHSKIQSDGFLAKESLGWYVVGAYDIFSLLMPDSKQSLEPFFRYDRVDTQRSFQSTPASNCGSLPSDGTSQPTGSCLKPQYNNEIFTVGLQYKPIPQVVLKLDYRYNRQKVSGEAIDKQVQFGAGYVF